MSADTRKRLIEGLRAVAAFYENNPRAYYDGTTVFLNLYAGKTDAMKIVSATAAAFGEWEDLSDDRHVVVAKSFGAVRVKLFAPRGRVFRSGRSRSTSVLTGGEASALQRLDGGVEWRDAPWRGLATDL